MSTIQVVLQPNTWIQIATGKKQLLIQASEQTDLYIGSTAPDNTAPGFDLNGNYPNVIQLEAFGGAAWVRGQGTATYATD